MSGSTDDNEHKFIKPHLIELSWLIPLTVNSKEIIGKQNVLHIFQLSYFKNLLVPICFRWRVLPPNFISIIFFSLWPTSFLVSPMYLRDFAAIHYADPLVFSRFHPTKGQDLRSRLLLQGKTYSRSLADILDVFVCFCCFFSPGFPDPF